MRTLQNCAAVSLLTRCPTVHSFFQFGPRPSYLSGVCLFRLFAARVRLTELGLVLLVLLICDDELDQEFANWRGLSSALPELNQPSCPSHAARVAVHALIAVPVNSTRAFGSLMRAVTSPAALSAIEELSERGKEK